MSDDLGDFLKEAAKRRKERRERQESQKSRAQAIEPQEPPARSLGEGETEVRQTLSGQSQFGRQQAMAEIEAARYAARERAADRVGFAQRSAAEAKPKATPRAGVAATSSPVPGAFSQGPAAARPAEVAGETGAQALLRLLRSPGGMRQAVLMAEVLRPKHLDG